MKATAFGMKSSTDLQVSAMASPMSACRTARVFSMMSLLSHGLRRAHTRPPVRHSAQRAAFFPTAPGQGP